MTEGLYCSLRIVNALGYEISLETGFHESSSYPTDVSRVVWLPVAPTCSTNSPVRTEWTRMVDARTGHRTWTPGTGHWTSDTGRADTGHRTPDTGCADAGRVPDAGHWTGGRWTCGRGQGDQGAVGVRTSWYHDTAGQRTVLLWAAAAHAALGNHDGSAVRPPASARDCGLHCQASRWVAPPAAKRHLGALLSSDSMGGG